MSVLVRSLKPLLTYGCDDGDTVEQGASERPERLDVTVRPVPAVTLRLQHFRLEPNQQLLHRCNTRWADMEFYYDKEENSSF